MKRIVPRENESINETWLADRDRFSYEAIYSSDRLQTPRIKESGEWRELDWEEALSVAADRLKDASAEKVGKLASPSSTLEEGHLLSRIAAHLGTANIDHRIERRDFSDQDNDPVFPWLGCDIADIEKQDAIFVIGSNLRSEAPILAHRVRKAALGGASVNFASSEAHEYFFGVDNYLSGAGLVSLLSGDDVEPVIESLKKAGNSLVLLGNIAARHEAYASVRALAAQIAKKSNSKLGSLSSGANSAGLSLAGVLPHRTQGGQERSAAGADAGTMLDQSLETVVLLNVEPDADLLAVPDALDKLGKQQFVVALTPFVSESLCWNLHGSAPARRYVRGNLRYIRQCRRYMAEFLPARQTRLARLDRRGRCCALWERYWTSTVSTTLRLRTCCSRSKRKSVIVVPDNSYKGDSKRAKANGEDAAAAEIDIPLYSVDGMVRRAKALQLTVAARQAASGDDA